MNSNVKSFRYLYFVTLVLLQSSCLVIKKNENAIEKSYISSRMINYKAFLVLNNGDTINGTKWDLKKSKYLLLDGKKFIDSSVKSFQSPYGLATRYQSSKSANSFKDQWAYYLVRGKINLFSVEKFNGTNNSYDKRTNIWSESPTYVTTYYYNLNVEESFLNFDIETLKELIKDSPKAVEEFDKSGINSKSWFWQNKAIEILNVYNKNYR